MNKNDMNLNYKDFIIAHYKFNDQNQAGKDSSGFGNNAVALGTTPPKISMVDNRMALSLTGGNPGTSYMKLPTDLLQDVSDHTGLTISTWVNFATGQNVWERIFDFGKNAQGPYIFLTRNLRGVCNAGSDIAVDPGKGSPLGEWIHIAMSVTGTKGGTESSAGPILYLNGELISDGSISQTSSGAYGKLRTWFETFNDSSNYSNNYIGKSQFDVDPDFSGALSDFRIYKKDLSQDQVIEIMCESLTDEDIITLARDKYLNFPTSIIVKDINLPQSLMGGKVEVIWTSSNPKLISDQGKLGEVSAPQAVTLTALLKRGNYQLEKSFDATVLPEGLPPYSLTIDGSKEVLDISDVLYGLFYEDINNAADGGIYGELVQNRSFESFTFDTFSPASGENAVSTGRNHNPLHAWFGDLDLVKVQNKGGLNEHFNLRDPEINSYYITVSNGATLYNRGFCDSNGHCSMHIKEGVKYYSSLWAKAKQAGTITLQLLDPDGNPLSDTLKIEVDGSNTWNKYGANESLYLLATNTMLGQLSLSFQGDISIDMVSLMPSDLWGSQDDENSKTAHSNYQGNPNYRLRKDLVEALLDLHPKFLRFPGGCISEGSYIWDNVYDWKDSVGDIELRKENFNVWGYMMTMGLGYMEYFQLAEDLNATPLPVMACGVLCQARSDYANPAGGSLRDKYIKNFTDLIDFAISEDFENNEWAALRKKMGHPTPFDLHYLGVGNENWGTEFFANFEIFKAAIDAHMEKYYPGYELHIISTVGAQADDDAYQEGWKFLSGNYTGSANIRFTDGTKSTEETISWYQYQKDYMETIADEHYYRSNLYLVNNADRYNYYYRAYNNDGSIDKAKSSKVFVGEYASTDKNTLAGAVAEAAIMTGFERNSDVVLLTAYAPLFNKVLTDGQYRWTPDLIWFDNESVWRTPNYYVQQLFAKYLGNKLLATSFQTYRNGHSTPLIPYGGIEIATGNAEITVKSIKVISNVDGSLLLDQDFTQDLDPAWKEIPGSIGYTIDKEKGLILKAQANGLNGLYILNDAWTNYRVEVLASKNSGLEGFYLGVGLTDIGPDKKDVIEYAINYKGDATGVKVYKNGVEGYTLGDYSSSSCAGNLRAACFEKITEQTDYTITVDFGGATGDRLICSYTDGNFTSKVLDYKLEAYNKDVFHSVTRDAKHVYAKLVNTDHYDKSVQIDLKDLKVAETGKLVTLSGDSTLVHISNVNGKNDELIQPVEDVISLKTQGNILNLPANSVNVLIMDIQ